MTKTNKQQTSMATREEAQKEVDQNYQAFQKLSFRDEDRKKFALMHNGKLVNILETRTDAHIMGRTLYEDGIYSVQEIDPLVGDLGFMGRFVDSQS